MEIKNEANESLKEIENEIDESSEEIENEADELLKKIGENPYSAFKTLCNSIETYLLEDKKDIKKYIQPIILRIIKAKPKFTSKTVGAFTQTCLSQGKKISDIQPTILKIIEENPNLVYIVTHILIQVLLVKKQNISDIQEIISKIIELDCTKQNRNFVFDTVCALLEVLLSKKEYISYIQPTILKIIKAKPEFASKTVDALTRAYLSKGKKISDIEPTILKIIEENPNLVYIVTHILIQVLLVKKQNISDIQEIISKIIELDCTKQNRNFVFDTVCALLEVLLSKKEYISYIQPTILEIIKKNQDSEKLVFNTVRAYLQTCLLEGKYKELLSNFENFLEEVKKCVKKGDKIVNSLNSFSILILSQYLKDTLFTLKENEEKSSLLKKHRDEKLEEKITKLLGKLYQGKFEDISNNFKNIKIKDLIPIWKKYFKNKIDILSINSGNLNETLLYILEIFKDKTIGYLFDEEFKQKFKNFYFIDLCKKNGEKQLKNLINKSLEEKEKDKYFVCYTIIPRHEIISIIKNGNIKLIDSSQTSSEKYKEILNKPDFKNEKIDYFNEFSYQENGTCYLNATLAFKVIMKKLYNKIDKELINEELINDNLTEVINDLKGPLVKLKVKIAYNNVIQIIVQKIVFEIFKESENFYKTLGMNIYQSEYLETKEEDEKLILKKGLTEILRKLEGKLNVIESKQTEEYGKPSQKPSKSKMAIQAKNKQENEAQSEENKNEVISEENENEIKLGKGESTSYSFSK